MKCCELCKREKKLTFHHLVPRKSHKIKHIRKKFSQLNLNTYGIKVCRDCHKMIHKCIPHKSLALNFNTLEKLLTHTDLSNFVNWVKFQTKNVK